VDRGDRLTHEELVTMVGNLIVGGHDTTASQIGCTTLTMLRHPTIADALRRGTTTATDVANETIRFEPSLGFVPRTLLEPMASASVPRSPV
jgi:cytochrome P450